MKKILSLANNFCPHCNGTGTLPHPNVGFKLAVGDIVEDHCGLQVKVDEVWEKDNTMGWGTTLNALDIQGGPNHSNHRINTDNDFYTESLWRKMR